MSATLATMRCAGKIRETTVREGRWPSGSAMNPTSSYGLPDGAGAERQVAPTVPLPGTRDSGIENNLRKERGAAGSGRG